MVFLVVSNVLIAHFDNSKGGISRIIIQWINVDCIAARVHIALCANNDPAGHSTGVQRVWCTRPSNFPVRKLCLRTFFLVASAKCVVIAHSRCCRCITVPVRNLLNGNASISIAGNIELQRANTIFRVIYTGINRNISILIGIERNSCGVRPDSHARVLRFQLCSGCPDDCRKRQQHRKHQQQRRATLDDVLHRLLSFLLVQFERCSLDKIRQNI